jgi:hypothetical protein
MAAMVVAGGLEVLIPGPIQESQICCYPRESKSRALPVRRSS